MLKASSPSAKGRIESLPPRSQALTSAAQKRQNLQPAS
jgi:hypothetical protein